MISPKEAYEYLYNLLELSGDLKWPLCIDSMNIFKELVDEKLAKPTEEEIIKEWEEEGFEVTYSKERFEVYKQWIERKQKTSHHTSAKVVIEKDFFYIVGKINKYTHLLIKTFKALDWSDE